MAKNFEKLIFGGLHEKHALYGLSYLDTTLLVETNTKRNVPPGPYKQYAPPPTRFQVSRDAP
jgi:hypothetical protein